MVYFTVIILIFGYLISANKGCLKLTPQAQFDANTLIEVVGDPNVFVPDSVYTVNLKSVFEFEKFIITLQNKNNSGNLQILNAKDATFDENCLGTIIETTIKPRKQIQVLWRTPNSGCVIIKAQVRRNKEWFITNKKLCSANVEEKLVIPECCTCDHAKYKIAFEGLWSPETHPKDFPTSLWLTHFSDLIGASHVPNYTMWKEGGYASYGLKQLAEYGIVREMENELRLESTKLRSIVKAAGLWHPNLNGITHAVFRVDPRRHLLSLASMFGPSPDWIVGVSALNLCLPNCTWLERMEMDLYPYDAGTDSGRTYMSIKTATEPPERIRRITTKFPDDPHSPFYNPDSNEMPSLAKLLIERDKVIPKLCSDLTQDELLQQISESENSEDGNRPECAVSEYSTWSECSVTCGKGLRMRSRNYLSPKLAEMEKCDRQLVSREMCTAEEQKCPGDPEEEEEVMPLIEPGECEVTDWTEWSDCSVTCGIGVKIRSRSFLSHEPSVIKKCMHIATSEMEKCMLPACHLNEKKISRACSVKEWSEWSPCSVSCGHGIRTRIRQFHASRPPPNCLNQITLLQNLTCSAPECKLDHVAYKEICLSKPLYGPCRGNFTRWAFSKENGKCDTFLYGGCRGNKNNFLSEEECKEACLESSVKKERSKSKQDSFVNCVVSNWSNWSFCSPCTNGTKTKTRTVIKKPRNGGRLCPILTKTIKCSVPKDFCDLMFSNN